MSAIIFKQVVESVKEQLAEKSAPTDNEIKHAVTTALHSTNFNAKFTELVEFARVILKEHGRIEAFDNDEICLCDLTYHTNSSIWDFVSKFIVETQGFCGKPSEMRQCIINRIIEKTKREVIKT